MAGGEGGWAEGAGAGGSDALALQPLGHTYAQASDRNTGQACTEESAIEGSRCTLPSAPTLSCNSEQYGMALLGRQAALRPNVGQTSRSKPTERARPYATCSQADLSGKASSGLPMKAHVLLLCLIEVLLCLNKAVRDHASPARHERGSELVCAGGQPYWLSI